MKSNVVNKKLLILGATFTEIEIIKEVHKNGYYAIVTDDHVDWKYAPAKYVADEAWDISWSDLRKLKEKCIDRGVDGVIAGFSEKRIFCANELCNILGLPFYAQDAKIDVIIDKLKFKQACIDSGISVPKAYEYGDRIEFPVIVKPADNGGSRGITICHQASEFEAAYQKALDSSDNKSVVIEQYIVADETMVYFTVHNGIVDVSAMCDRYMHHFGNDITQLPVGYFYPSKHLYEFYRNSFEKYKKLINNLGIRNGLIAFQSFATEKELVPFDPTYRLDGTMTYHICENITGSNVLSMLINYSMTGSMGDDLDISTKETPAFPKFAFQLPILLKNGTIGDIRGLDAIRNMPEVIHVYLNHAVGDIMTKSADFSQILCRIHLVAESVFDIRKAVDLIYNTILVLDTCGDNMIICKMDTSKIGQ